MNPAPFVASSHRDTYPDTNSMLPHESFRLLQQEGYLFQSSLTQGLTALRNANDSQKGNFYVAFFQLSIGLERLMKSAIIVHYMATNNLTRPSQGTLKSLGHRLLDLFSYISKLRISEPNPLVEIEEDTISYDLLCVLDEFARSTRYFNLDSLSSTATTSDPLRDYDNVIERILKENVRQVTVEDVAEQRSVIASLVSQTSMGIDPGAPHESSHDTLQRMFVNPRLQDLAARHAVYHVIKLIDSLKRFVSNVSCAAQVLDRNASVPCMHEFLEFAWLDRKYILRKKRWP